MKRRNFIKLSAFTALCLTFDIFKTPLFAGESTQIEKTVINIALDGGPDFRYLIVPPFSDVDGSYGLAFWKAKASIFDVSSGDNDAMQSAYSDNYDEITLSGVTCGVLKTCAWLKDEIVAGNVAIINNVIASTNRDHHHSTLILESGSLSTGSHDVGVSGWAGRAAKLLNSNVVSVSQGVRLLCNGPHSTNEKDHDNSVVISNYNSRDVGLYNYDTQADLDSGSTEYRWSSRAIMSRSLKSYYSVKNSLIADNSPYKKFVKHEQQLRIFGDQLKSALDSVAIPDSISALYEGDSPLNSKYFGKQILSIYDSFATQDILNMRLASMEYTGWDSHKRQRTQIEPQFSDIFGTNKALHSLITELDALNSGIYEDTVFTISGEFGRQLKSNGDHGCDHGRGNSMIVIGKSVNGGFYGEAFPDSEIDKLEVKNEDIEGKTSIFQVYASVLNWQETDLGNNVFDLTGLEVESGVNLDDLLS